jgi:hypothetical protein
MIYLNLTKKDLFGKYGIVAFEFIFLTTIVLGSTSIFNSEIKKILLEKAH